MDFINYIAENSLILVPVLWIIGTFLKKIPRIPDWVIPWVLVGCGISGAIGTIGMSADAVIQGVLVAGASVLGHQLYKQTTERE